jgi:hypothetical protein
MQPCGVCGGTLVDAAGHCTTCGTYRGLPAPGYGPPVQSSGPPYQSSGPPYQPSGPPYQASPPPYQASPPPYQAGPAAYPPNPGGSWPGYPPAPQAPAPQMPVLQTPVRSRGSLVVPLIALSAVLVVITAAIVVVAFLRNRQGTVQPTPSASGQLSASSLIDPCVLGTWTETAHQEDVAVEKVGTVKFTGKGAIQHFKPDGVAMLDYGSGVSLVGSSGSTTWEYVYTGTITFHYQTSNGNILYTDTSANGTTTLKVNGKVQSSGPIEAGSLDPERYTCSGNSLREYTAHYSIELTRNT